MDPLIQSLREWLENMNDEVEGGEPSIEVGNVEDLIPDFEPEGGEVSSYITIQVPVEHSPLITELPAGEGQDFQGWLKKLFRDVSV